MTEYIKESWNTSKSTKKQQWKLTEELLLAPTFDENCSKKVDHEIQEALFRFLATVNRQHNTSGTRVITEMFHTYWCFQHLCQLWAFISRSIPGFDYTRLEPCTYWAEEDTNNNNSMSVQHALSHYYVSPFIHTFASTFALPTFAFYN